MKSSLFKRISLYFLYSLIVTSILFYIYEPITLGFDGEDLLTLFIPGLIILTLVQWIIDAPLWKYPFLGHAVPSLLWAITFPQLFHWSYSKPFYFYEFANDFLFGLTLFGSLSLLHYILTVKVSYPKLLASIFGCVQIGFSIIPLAQIGYYISTWHSITPATLMAFYQTNPEEAFGFVKNLIGITGIICIIASILALLYFLYILNCGMNKLVASRYTIYEHSSLYETRAAEKNDASFSMLRRSQLIVSIFLILGFIGYGLSEFSKTCIISNYHEVDTYMKELQSYSIHHKEIYNALQLDTKETAAQKLPGTIILVIGESSSRDYMKVYNPKFPYDDTPWQDTLRSNQNFIVFNNTYTSYPQTVPSLERALTERNQYEDKPFVDAVTIIDVAKKAGYYTSWFSNQGVYGEYDTAISLIAKEADTAKWAHESFAFSDQYDGALLNLLQQADPNKNNFIVIHIMGSHIYYNDRYPHEFSKWKKGANPDGIEAYANSQLYTDWLLKEIYTYGKEHLNLQAMLYFSDHGENVEKGHNPDIFQFDMTRIPMWLYLSPSYEAAYPMTTNTLRNHANQYFTNDLLYDMLVGLIDAPSPYYNRTRDFSNPAYRFNKDNLTTMLGTVKVSDDKGIGH